MATKLIAPRPGEGVEELTIVSWLKSVGDHVDEMEPIVEVETDKVVTEFPSPVAGTLLRIDVPAGETVRVGEAMGLVGNPGEENETASAAPAPTAAASPALSEAVTEPSPASVPGPGTAETTAPTGAKSGFLSPLVKKMAADQHIDLSQVQGTGEGGRITKADLLAYAERQTNAPAAPSAAPAAARPAVAPAIAAAPAMKAPATGGKIIPLTPTRRQIAERMVQSVLTSPHVLSVMEADMTRVLAHRAAHKQEFAQRGINLTLTAYFVSALAKALSATPKMNASWTDEGIFSYDDVNIGMAVALGEAGLIVPVIQKAQELSLEGIARRVNDLSERARSKKLLPEEVRGGTFSLTNHGTGGSLFASPIINQPQLGILGTGMMQKRAVVVTDAEGNDSIAIRPMVYLSLVFDHRVIDGESGDAFLMIVKQTLENWA